MPVTLQALTGTAGTPPGDWASPLYSTPAGEPVPCLQPEDGPEMAINAGDMPRWEKLNSHYPLPPVLDRPSPKPGRIVWPCWGATRYAVGHLLITASNLAALRAVSGWTGEVLVTLDDGATDPPSTLRMWVVAARPVADVRSESSESLPSDDDHEAVYLLTVTDHRGMTANGSFLFWSLDPPYTGASYPTTWGAIVSDALLYAGYTTWQMTVSATSINTTLGAISPAYPAPAKGGRQAWWSGAWKQSAERMAVVADAACAQVNLRAAYDGRGNLAVQDAGAAGTAFSDWWGQYGSRCLSGGLCEPLAEWPRAVLYFFASDREGLSAGSASLPGYGTGQFRKIPYDGTGLTNPAAFLPIHIQAHESSGVYANWFQRFAEDVTRWLEEPQPDCTLWGYPPAPWSGVPCWVVYDTGEGLTRIERPQPFWPWPLLGEPPASLPEG